MNTIIPIPKIALSVRVGTMADLAFIDALQKKHTKQVGWMPTKQLEVAIARGQIIVAEDEARQPVGYCNGKDQYFKRDDVGIIYQMNVVPGKQRGLVGATLLKGMFERAAYGCKLFCCWCAQDIEANRFWEAMGFVALAFRTGGRGSGSQARIHIFWQRRIRAGDTTTAWWFPSQTSNGAVREDRIVLPIPPGTHWSDAKPIVLPGADGADAENGEAKRLPGPRKKREKKVSLPPSAIVGGGLRFGPIAAVAGVAGEQTAIQKPMREKIKAQKNDPKLIAAARELRDRWLEKVNAGEYQIEANGKYEVSRCLTDGRAAEDGAEREVVQVARGQIEGTVVDAVVVEEAKMLAA